VGLTSQLLYLFEEPVQRGFFCDDESIRYPRPASQTVSDVAVALVAVGVPVFVVRERSIKISSPAIYFLALSASQSIMAKTLKDAGV
jgi:hypothetical protein